MSFYKVWVVTPQKIESDEEMESVLTKFHHDKYKIAFKEFDRERLDNILATDINSSCQINEVIPLGLNRFQEDIYYRTPQYVHEIDGKVRIGLKYNPFSEIAGFSMNDDVWKHDLRLIDDTFTFQAQKKDIAIDKMHSSNMVRAVQDLKEDVHRYATNEPINAQKFKNAFGYHFPYAIVFNDTWYGKDDIDFLKSDNIPPKEVISEKIIDCNEKWNFLAKSLWENIPNHYWITVITIIKC